MDGCRVSRNGVERSVAVYSAAACGVERKRVERSGEERSGKEWRDAGAHYRSAANRDSKAFFSMSPSCGVRPMATGAVLFRS